MTMLLRRILDHQVARFLIGGASTTLVSYGAYLLLLRWLPYLAAYAIAFALGIAWSYATNVLFVFRTTPTVVRALAFPLVYLVQWAVGSVMLIVAVDGLRIPASLGPLVVVVATLPLTYLLSRWILVARSPRTGAAETRAADSTAPLERMRVMDGWLAAAVATVLTIVAYAPVDMKAPIVTAGDAASAQYIMKTVVEHGSYLENPDVGAPFGATMHDYPIPEPTNHLILRVLGMFTHDTGTLFNLFYFLSFVTAAYAAWWSLRSLGIERASAIAGAVAFALLPYHFLRNHHVFLASYAAIPIFCRYAVQIGAFRAAHLEDAPRVSWSSVAMVAIAAGAGIYYAYFGLLFVTFAAVLGTARTRSTVPLRVGAVYAATIVFVIAASLVPNIAFRLSHGANPLIAARVGSEAEYYGLRITQMVFPTIGHRIAAWHQAIVAYSSSGLKASENFTAALGIIGTLGFTAAIAFLFLGDRRLKPARWTAGALATAAVLYATISGFGAIVALLALPEIRGLNRISVFIAFLSLFVVLDCMGPWMRQAVRARWIVAAAIIAIAYVDQVPIRMLNRQDPQAYFRQRAFDDHMQAALPIGTSVFELPYTFFPESPQRGGSYLLIEPYLRTHGFRWSFGTMRGRPSDIWYERASRLTGQEFTDALATAGFAAVYVDGRAYEDNGAAIEASLRTLFGAPIVEDAATRRALFRVPPARAHARPLVVASTDRGWDRGEGTGTTAPRTWSTGTARLAIANPTAVPQRVRVTFKLASQSIRKVDFVYAAQTLAVVTLTPAATSDISIALSAAPGITYLDLDTDVSAQSFGNGDTRHLGFRLSDLSVIVE